MSEKVEKSQSQTKGQSFKLSTFGIAKFLLAAFYTADTPRRARLATAQKAAGRGLQQMEALQFREKLDAT